MITYKVQEIYKNNLTERKNNGRFKQKNYWRKYHFNLLDRLCLACRANKSTIV